MPSGLVVIDMLNSYDFEDAENLVPHVEQALPAIRSLIHRAREEGVEVVYVNDNYGDWNTSADELLDRALHGRHPELVEPVRPPEDASFVIKARHSIFYGTPLEYLLRSKEIDRVVLTGQVTEQCVLYSALDAYVRHFRLAVPADAVAAIHPDLAQAALEMMERNMRAEIEPAARCRLRD
jgi:nicotinamidase-related amidase